VQLRYQSGLSGEDYVSLQAWRNASLTCCPLHPDQGCGFARHGTYERLRPPGSRIARWYCPPGHQTFSLLPDCLASRLSGTLVEVEQVAAEVETARTLEALADQVRPDSVLLPGALRWIRRRASVVHATLTILIGLMPELFAGCQPTLTSFRLRLQVHWVLVALREVAHPHLASLPPPLGFGPRLRRASRPRRAVQQSAGPDPPARSG